MNSLMWLTAEEKIWESDLVTKKSTSIKIEETSALGHFNVCEVVVVTLLLWLQEGVRTDYIFFFGGVLNFGDEVKEKIGTVIGQE